jgi:hypothetical protein
MIKMRAFMCFLALVLLPQCGGGTATGEGPKSAGDDSKSSADSTAAASDRGKRGKRGEDEGEQSSSDASTPEKSKGPTCDDGTCSKCGSGICPAGWYCDEKASGGAACSWLAECPEKPTCACVTRVLGASCKCREESGGLKVACD